MSLYNIMTGFNPNARICVAMLAIDPETIPRFRDAWLSDDGTDITLLTRTGGGNREDYQDENDALAAHAGYVGDHDDDFDSTFAHFVFKTPEQFVADAKILAGLMILVGKSAAEQGPLKATDRAIAAIEGKSAPAKSSLTVDDPRVVAAGKAYDRIRKALQSS